MPAPPSLPSAFSDSNNPFRRRHASQPQTTSGTVPPLPPRRASLAPTLPPRKKPPVAAQSSISSSDSLFSPTSASSPSRIIKQSLDAANRKTTSRPEPSLHIIQSSQQNGVTKPSRRSALVEEVTSALRQAELDGPSSFQTIADSYKENEQSLQTWDCVDILNEDALESPKYAMVIVNQPIRDRDIFARAWDASKLRFCADGGANRLFDLWDGEARKLYLPDMIKGDLDSIREDIKSFYSSMDRDEDSTDLMKCIAEVKKREQAGQYPLLIIGGLSGRIDQTVHTLSLLYKLRKTRSQAFVLSGESLAWVLDEGSHLINIDHTTMGQTCGILPVGTDGANVTTKGLKWNLDWSTSLDGDVSTSNHLLPEEPVVYLRTDRPVMWCVEVRDAST